jgi:hypothetical protein
MTSRKRSLGVVGATLAVFVLLPLTGCQASQQSGDVALDSDDLGGVVTGQTGPEAGVWVVAETTDLPTKFVRIVVTDDQGRYVLPDLPEATYDVWVRGYGLVDSAKVQATPGNTLDLTAMTAPTAAAAAEYYPASYWHALAEPPAESEFPGTGPNGNGIATGMNTQADWLATMRCGACHQIGSEATREFPESLGTFSSSVEAWDRRLKSGQMAPTMYATLSQFGAQRALSMYADWTDRIEGGEVPEAPPRPQGVERNVVISMWDWNTDRGFVHDTISTDKRDPTLHANGPVYSISRYSAPEMNILDPTTHTVEGITVGVRDEDTPFTTPQMVLESSPYWGDDIIWSSKPSLHNPMLDEQGRVWLTHAIRAPETPAFCREGSTHPSAQAFPIDLSSRHASVYDPETQEFTMIDTCFGTHHLQFGHDADNTLWFSTSGTSVRVLGWFNTRLFDETGDEQAAQGWTPFILDTNGNGVRDDYVEPGQPADATKDTRITGGSYGVIASPVDESIWVANPGVPGSIIRVIPGANPSETALSEVYEPPFNNPASPVDAFSPRGIDIDRNGLIWTSLSGSSHLASFDRSKCTGPLNGPTATGQHCPEGWSLHVTPGPNFKGVTQESNGDLLYYNWVDQFNALGLGENVPLVTGSYSDALLALLEDEWVVMRVPYPMGFYHRGVEGRIDDPDTDWKGRGLWANYGPYTPWHIEGGKGTTSKAVHFQMRPDPLAK